MLPLERDAVAVNVVNQIVLDEILARVAVEIDTAGVVDVGVVADMVDHVAADHTAWGVAQDVDPAVVTEDVAHVVVDMVVLDDVLALEDVRVLSPTPSNGDARVVKVGDFVVPYLVERA